MEAGDSAAGDGDKEQREDARGAVRHVIAQRRCGQRRAGNEEGSVQNGQAHKELEAVDVVARLQQHPHRQQRSDEGVDE